MKNIYHQSKIDEKRKRNRFSELFLFVSLFVFQLIFFGCGKNGENISPTFPNNGYVSSQKNLFQIDNESIEIDKAPEKIITQTVTLAEYPVTIDISRLLYVVIGQKEIYGPSYLKYIDIEGKSILSIDIGKEVNYPVLSYDHRYLLYFSGNNNAPAIIDLNNKKMGSLSKYHNCNRAAWSPKELKFAMTCPDGINIFQNIDNNWNVILKLPKDDSLLPGTNDVVTNYPFWWMEGDRFGYFGDLTYVVYEDYPIRNLFWINDNLSNVDTGNLVYKKTRLERKLEPNNYISPHPNKPLLVASTEISEPVISIFNLDTGDLINTKILPGREAISSLIWSPDGLFIAYTQYNLSSIFSFSLENDDTPRKIFDCATVGLGECEIIAWDDPDSK